MSLKQKTQKRIQPSAGRSARADANPVRTASGPPAGPAAAGPAARVATERRTPLQAPQTAAGGMAPLHECVSEALEGYFAALDGQAPVGLYDFVMAEVERPLLKAVMQQVAGNQSRAAEMLGLNRGTLRKKLKYHGLLEN
jgi:Fis family transcriptional regulator, factor for inversion stimulation protein